MDKITIHAMAKINLGLDVLRRRENGYHDVKMIMQTVDLYDRLSFQKKKKPGISLSTDHEMVPCDESNLVYKAAALMAEKYDIKEGIHITLEKHIPIAAGMAGGSTDAAAAFVGINRLFDLKAETEDLKKLAVTIGADVPYCIEGGTALSEGIGEILSPLPAPPFCYLVIAKPGISVSTAYVYGNLHVETLEHHPDIDGMTEAIQNGDLEKMCSLMENVLERVTKAKYPVLGDLESILQEKGAIKSMMSGSGPTVFGIFNEKEKAEAALEAVKETGYCEQCVLTTFAKEAQVVVEEMEDNN